MNPYLEAAEFVFDLWAHYSCVAVERAFLNRGATWEAAQRKSDAYSRVFSPEGTGGYATWLDVLPPDERREHRLTALCFAAAMHETGDL